MPEQIPIPSIDFAVILQLIIVFGWGTLLLLIDFAVPTGRKHITGWLAAAGLVVAAIVGIPYWNSSTSTFNDMIRLDNYALTFNWIFLTVGVLTILISLEYLSRHKIERGEFYSILLFAIGGMMLLAQGTDLIVLFLGLELLSISLYVLVGFSAARFPSEEASMKYLIVGAFAAGFLVFGIALTYGATGLSNLAAIAAKVADPSFSAEDQLLMLAGGALLLIGFGYKIAMAPFHMWTPDVYEGAPTPVTAFMSAGTKAAGFAALTRVLLVALGPQYEVWSIVVAVLAAITMIFGNIAAVAQLNVKRMLAYSSIGHAGYILLGLLSANARGIESILVYLAAYTFTAIGAFAVLIALEQQGEEAWNLTDFAGLWGRHPFLAIAMAICMFSMAGVPPTFGFVAKFDVFTAAWQAGYTWLVLIAVITSAVAAFFYLRIVVQMFMKEPVREVPAEVGRGLSVGIGLAALGVVVLGILPTPVIEIARQSVQLLGQ
jgi:NADH-quinone oxidoreductase subunit N